MKLLKLLPYCLAAWAGLCQAQTPEWIWHTKHAADGEVRYFRKEFNLDAAPPQAEIKASCDNEALVYLNGKEVGETKEWGEPLVKDVAKLLHKGENVIAVRGKNHEGAAALVVRLQYKNADGSKGLVVSDASWKSTDKEVANWMAPGFDTASWHAPVVIAKLGDGPWNNVFSGHSAKGGPSTAAEDLETLPGFTVEKVLDADKERHGSWVSMAKDDQGRLILASQTGDKITRLTLKDGKVVNDEDLKLPFSDAMGMLWAFDSLYINANGKSNDGSKAHGIFRLQDTHHDGHFDKIEQIFQWGNHSGSGEHGSHGMVVGPDGKIYVVSGNFTDVPTSVLPSSPHRNFADDLVDGRAEDGNGFGAGRKPPGGTIVRIDPDGKNPELFAAGERNTYDIAFNADGELFGFDSDMEWDWGMPWYRPIRIFHAVSGADQGFREGSGKWPTYYPDSVPQVVNVGVGSPTGVIFGTGAKFPAKYQNALYVLDWTYGRLIAAHLQPKGATYTATWENFVAPASLHSHGGKRPLDLTAAIVGNDGALYFTVGGRGTQATLYRVTYTGKESTAAADGHQTEGADARAQRHRLEAFHGKQDPKAVDIVWPYLSNEDRSLRYAARIALESQPVEQWQDRALKETQPEAALQALLALARLGSAETQPALLKALEKFPLKSLSEAQQLGKIRVVEVTVARNGVPQHAEAIAKELNDAYPAATIPLNRELCQTLVALNVPDVVAKSLKLLAAAPTQEEQITYILFLRNMKSGWTLDSRKTYFDWWVHRPAATHSEETLKWFTDAGREYGDGSSFQGFLGNFHKDAEKTLSSEEIDKLQAVLTAYVPPTSKAHRKPAKQRDFVKVWTMADLEPSLGEVAHHRNFENGRDCFAAAQCILCHRFGDEGGAVGPDLTSIAARFSMHDILESIIDPSKVISEQYANEELKLKNGDLAAGRIVDETPDTIVLRPSLLAPDLQKIKKADVASKQLSKISPMPPALMSSLSKSDVLDLLAYLASGGKKDAPAFAK